MQWEGSGGERHREREAEYSEGFDICQNKDKNKMWWKQSEEMTSSYEHGQQRLTEAPMSHGKPWQMAAILSGRLWCSRTHDMLCAWCGAGAS